MSSREHRPAQLIAYQGPALTSGWTLQGRVFPPTLVMQQEVAGLRTLAGDEPHFHFVLEGPVDGPHAGFPAAHGDAPAALLLTDGGVHAAHAVTTTVHRGGRVRLVFCHHAKVVQSYVYPLSRGHFNYPGCISTPAACLVGSHAGEKSTLALHHDWLVGVTFTSIHRVDWRKENTEIGVNIEYIDENLGAKTEQPTEVYSKT